MKTNTFLKIAVLIMVLINVVLIGFMIVGPKMPPRGKQDDLKEIISEKLNLNEEQRASYFQLAKSHNEAMSQVNQKQKPMIREYFNYLKLEAKDPAMQDSLLELINQLDQDKLTLTYSHFEELKKICDPDQVVIFEKIMDEIFQVLVGGQKKSLPPPRD
ncbi:MAG: protein CpxP [Algoriphagus sp.]|jgi:protein CpxP